MTATPAQPKLYHITHVDNLTSIVTTGALLSDVEMKRVGMQGPVQMIGISDIKQRRCQLKVLCHPNTTVGEYVPFYFCPRSVMLYVIYCRNHPGLNYRGGQEEIIHLVADLHEVVKWANGARTPWAFSLSNAGALYAEFRARLGELDQLDWAAIAATDFRSREVKERKQAEFLVHRRLPFELIERIGVHSAAVQTRVTAALAGTRHRPSVEVLPDWYY